MTHLEVATTYISGSQSQSIHTVFICILNVRNGFLLMKNVDLLTSVKTVRNEI